MPVSDLHKQKAKKNYAVLGMLVAFIALIFVVTIIKMSYYSEKGREMREESANQAQVTQGDESNSGALNESIQEALTPTDEPSE